MSHLVFGFVCGVAFCGGIRWLTALQVDASAWRKYTRDLKGRS